MVVALLALGLAWGWLSSILLGEVSLGAISLLVTVLASRSLVVRVVALLVGLDVATDWLDWDDRILIVFLVFCVSNWVKWVGYILLVLDFTLTDFLVKLLSEELLHLPLDILFGWLLDDDWVGLRALDLLHELLESLVPLWLRDSGASRLNHTRRCVVESWFAFKNLISLKWSWDILVVCLDQLANVVLVVLVEEIAVLFELLVGNLHNFCFRLLYLPLREVWLSLRLKAGSVLELLSDLRNFFHFWLLLLVLFQVCNLSYQLSNCSFLVLDFLL